MIKPDTHREQNNKDINGQVEVAFSGKFLIVNSLIY